MYTLVLLKTGNAWDCVVMHVCNNFFAMFMRADVAPNLHDPVILSLLAGTLVVYSALSTHCVLSLKPPTDDSTEDGGGDKRQDIDVAGSACSPAFLGVSIGVAVYAGIWATQ